MPTKIGQTGLTFPDNTIQTTAAIAGAAGFGGFTNMQVFTSSGAFSVPAGVVKAKVTVVGGGASGGTGGTYMSEDITYITAFPCGGGGGTAIKTISSLIPGESITVTVGAGGAQFASSSDVAQNGNAGSTSSFGTYCSATGGSGSGTGGIGVNGSINIRGGAGIPNQQGVTTWSLYGTGGASGGSSFMAGGSRGAGNLYGGGGIGALNNGGRGIPGPAIGLAGAAGIVIVEY